MDQLGFLFIQKKTKKISLKIISRNMYYSYLHHIDGMDINSYASSFL